VKLSEDEEGNWHKIQLAGILFEATQNGSALEVCGIKSINQVNI
jgi:hypothetical protein